MTRGTRNYSERMRHIVEEYRASGQPWPATTMQMAIWAVNDRLWQPQRSAMIAQCADDLARAMREEYFTDPQGRSVRAKHAARIEQENKQLVLWADIRTAPREHMEIAFQQRRQQIVGDCRQLKTDVDSFNENRKPDRPIQMVFDFTEDLMELEALYSS